jgi:D-beta-D-heptose 7-phosphate kinase/D-beta-D-heptose 1-phosphate adenosyltransferase
MLYNKEYTDMSDEKRKTIMVSGGFDPVHVGHIRMIREAAEYGDVIVVANSDNWLHRKKGFVFMEFGKRSEILSSIKGVILVDSVDDTDGTVCEAIRRHQPYYFANGGDRGKSNTTEQDVCEEIGVELLWGIGGDYKADASSTLVNRFRKNTKNEEVAPTRAKIKHSTR